MKKKLSAFVFIISIIISATAQETEKKETKETKEEALKGTHRVSLVIGHSHISEGIAENGKKVWKVVPSWGFIMIIGSVITGL